ncbi:squalene/phytoene synthase family protein [Streptomyces zagrosensis]|uniref:Phytoene synthase n=1 Tax=Streptomyces zagrosensis TaxID=1042984 RepID=A0A7W9UWZ5_9ACTN|nr:squalene/phytoene synthase family protein [Streptomyces zagrosensis]MBB5934440.1 phytoene synthase [Streptomyces zagrosensis]
MTPAQELDAADVRDPRLREAYALCETILQHDNHASHTWMRGQLQPGSRPYWDAMIAFCGYADDLADALDVPLAERIRRYDAFTHTFFRMLHNASVPVPRSGPDEAHAEGERAYLVSLAFCDFVHTWHLSEAGIRQASQALRTDMSTEAYDTLTALERYMHGVSGEPARWLAALLGPRGQTPGDGAANAATAWSFGLQTLDFVLDLEEDVRLGKLYVPLDDLRQCGLQRADMERAVAARESPQALRDVVACQLVRVRRYFTAAERWMDSTRPLGWEAIRESLIEGWATVDRIARSGHDIFAVTAEPT